MPKCINKTFFIPNRKQNDKNEMKKKKKKNSNIRAAGKVFPH